MHERVDRPGRDDAVSRPRSADAPRVDEVEIVAEQRGQAKQLMPIVLEIHFGRHDDVEPRVREPGAQCGKFAEVPRETNNMHLRASGLKFAQHTPRAVGAAVVDEKQLARNRRGLQHLGKNTQRIVENVLAVVNGDEHGHAINARIIGRFGVCAKYVLVMHVTRLVQPPDGVKLARCLLTKSRKGFR